MVRMMTGERPTLCLQLKVLLTMSVPVAVRRIQFAVASGTSWFPIGRIVARASAPSPSHCRVQPLRLRAGVGSGELPIGFDVLFVVAVLPGSIFLGRPDLRSRRHRKAARSVIDGREHDGTRAAAGRQMRRHAPHRRLCMDFHFRQRHDGQRFRSHEGSKAMNRLHNKCTLITGGAGGIGLETARQFLAEGARVGITGANPDTLAAAKAELGVMFRPSAPTLATSQARRRSPRR
jgi:hypothetical protein